MYHYNASISIGFIFILQFLTVCAFGQTTGERIIKFNENKLVEVSTPLNNEREFFSYQGPQLGINRNHSFKLQRVFSDPTTDFVRKKYHQYFKDLRVIGGTYTLHFNNQKIEKSSGFLYPYIDLDIIPQIGEKEANTSAIEYMKIKLSMNVDKNAEWKIESNKLCILSKEIPHYKGNMTLAYEVVVFQNGVEFPIREKVYIDAKEGYLIDSFSKIKSDAVPAKAVTFHYGEQNIVTDSVGPNEYYLRDLTRGDGVITLNDERDVFFDDDNYWNNFNNARDEVAGDAHYCTSHFYDMMNDYFNWNGLDGEGKELISVVGARGQYYNNAYWDGTRTNYGNGDCERYHPFTTLDIVGHEFAHGFTDFTSDLVYAYESGALNESFSDIFGKALENYVDPSSFNWIIGDKIRQNENVNIIRSMSEPNLRNHPQYYGGNKWYRGVGDNGGVHFNSGVLNYWFYLLIEGKSDINEADVFYNVNSIGWQKAMQVVFIMQTGYLSELSQYKDAMYASLEACDDLFGENSDEKKEVLEAWKAVGLFPGIDDLDLQVSNELESIALCPDDEKFISVFIENVGRKPFPADTTLYIAFEQDDSDVVIEEFYVQDTLAIGDTLFYTFETPIVNDPRNSGAFQITLDTTDFNFSNNLSVGRIIASEKDGMDISLERFSFVTSEECGTNDLERFSYGVRNEGCQVIPKNDTFYFDIESNVGDFTLLRRVFSDNDPGDYQGGSATLLNFDIPEGIIDYKATFRYPNEVNAENNSIEDEVSFTESISEGYFEQFMDNYDEGKLILDRHDEYAYDTIIDYRGNTMLALTGTSDHENYDFCPDREGFFDEYNYVSTLSFCADARGMVDPVFEFNLIQLFNENRVNVLPEDDFSVMVRVVTDSMVYPIIYGQNERQLKNYQFEIPADYQSHIEIEVLTLSNEIDDTKLFLESRDASLFDDFRFYDRSNDPKIYNENGYIIYPNPSSSVVRIQSEDRNSEFFIQIFNELGQVLFESSRIYQQTWIDISNYANGIYFVRINDLSETPINYKVIKID